MGLLKNTRPAKPDIFKLIFGRFIFFGMTSASEVAASEVTTELACDVEAAVTSEASGAAVIPTTSVFF